MSRKLDEATKDYFKIRGRWEMPGFVLQFIGISVLVAGIIAKLSFLINWGTLLLGTGLIVLVIGTFIHKEIFKK